MAEKKKKILDYGLQIVRELIAGRLEDQAEENIIGGPVKLEDIKLDDLNREKIQLGQEQQKSINELHDIENRKRKLFDEGARDVSDIERRVIAEGVKELNSEAENMAEIMQVLSKQKRTINGLIQVKKRERLLSESGVSSILKDIDLQDLIKYIDKASVNGEFRMSKFDEILGTLERNDSVRSTVNADPDIDYIVAQMEQAHAASDGNPQAMDEHFVEMDKGLQEKKQKNLEYPEEDF